MCRQFVHVHNHTEYSLLDGANKIPDLVRRAKELDQPALAITDHGVMFGVVEFALECQKQGIKPILGMEAYVAPNGRHNKAGREDNQTYHLLLLAKNLDGYRNLCKLHTAAALQGFYYKPRIDHEILREHAKGLIGTSACLGSEICQFLLQGDYNRARDRAAMYRDMFDEDSYYIELQDHRLPEQAQIRADLIRIARELKLPLVATNDAHYLCRESHPAHDVLLCIGTGALVNDEKRLRFQTDEFYLKSRQEMAMLFPDVPEALENTLRIMEQCDVEVGKQRAPMPEPELPSGMDSRSYLRQLAEQGLKDRIPKLDDQAWERLNYELDVIEKTGFEDYFLLVREFAQFTRGQGIAFGVRGSAAGSLVSYTVGITDVDPLEYDLTFERFLNPERVSMPDIDMDFEDARRDEVIRWVTERYGKERVAQIITFGTLGAKAAMKDGGRVMGYTPQETDRICKTIPNIPGMTLKKALEASAEFRQMVDSEPRVTELLRVAEQIEGTARHAGVHAAGVVISKDPLDEYIPLYRGNDGQPVTAFEMGILEKLGVLKMDFLGLSNLTVLARTMDHIAQTFGKDHKIDVHALPLDDEATYAMLGRGETVGVFQLESGGMRRNIVELKPRSVQELAAMVALYRPGPMEHISTYVDNKFERTKPEYLDERMRPILGETYGVIVYQDQVLKLVQALAGFTLGKADILRRAMGKKNKQEMDSMQVQFVDGCAVNEIPKATANKIWELLLPFAGYAFNKAHAVCYALLAYQTAYLKANYPVEYMAALLGVYRDKEDRVTNFIEESRRQQIPVLPPDVNRSRVDFTIEAGPAGKAIRFGLAAIKGVGEGLVEGMITERAHGPFRHLYEFCERMKGAGLNRAALEALIKAGALDTIDGNRRRLMDFADGAMQFADQAHKNKIAGQDSLFGDGAPGSPGASSDYPALPDRPGLTRTEALAYEKEVLGIYVSDHPLRGLERQLRQASSLACGGLAEADDGLAVKLAGVIASVRQFTSKKSGERMASFVLEDFSGQVTCFCSSGVFAKMKDYIERDKVVSVSGFAGHRERLGSGGERETEVRVNDVTALDVSATMDHSDDDAEAGTLMITVRKATREQLEAVKAALEEAPGDFRVFLRFGTATTDLPWELRRQFEADDRLLNALRQTGATLEFELSRNPKYTARQYARLIEVAVEPGTFAAVSEVDSGPDDLAIAG